ncbi:hypothetical protein QBC40DRAFT_301854 [Triangularia verruculosa]|uniref:Uncharacterized protein n=1 Tax=Triangularia verruculosa TaxID=2587418 RepID=A0AAN6XBE8_9PEZI|nr:hypothetical protein QBC40DRAFT_301854 [Triangularia verruculosa]
MEFLDDSMTPTPQVSLLLGARRDIARALRCGASYASIMTRFSVLCKELRPPHSQGLPKFDRTRESLGGPGPLDFAGPQGLLFHSIPRDILTSLVLGTVVYESHDKQDPNGLKGLDSDGAGIYALGLKIHERNGKFLTAPEYKTLLNDFKQYVSIAKAMRDHQLVTVEQEGFVKEIDNQLGKWDKESVRFIKDNTRHAHAKLVYASLRRRWQALDQADPSGTVFSVKSPLYIGCSGDINKRWVDYSSHKQTHRQTLHGANKFLVLVTSLLKYRHLGVDIGRLAVLRIWEDGQLKDAELMVTLLANSYTVQDGFNVQEGGGTNDYLANMNPEKVADYREYVYGVMPHLRKNCEHSVAEVELAQRVAKEEEELEALQRKLDSLMESSALEEQRERVDGLIKTIPQMEKLIKAAQNRLQLRLQEKEALQCLVRSTGT